MSNGTFSECGKTLQNPSGAFSSPDYGNSSPPPEGEHCEWRITATQGERIILNITDIDVFKSENCDTDFLEVRDGYWYKSPLLGKSEIFSSVLAWFKVNGLSHVRKK